MCHCEQSGEDVFWRRRRRRKRRKRRAAYQREERGTGGDKSKGKGMLALRMVRWTAFQHFTRSNVKDACVFGFFKHIFSHRSRDIESSKFFLQQTFDRYTWKIIAWYIVLSGFPMQWDYIVWGSRVLCLHRVLLVLADLWPTFSLISSALLHRGSASLYFPLFPYRTARLLRVAATWRKTKGGTRLKKKSWASAPQESSSPVWAPCFSGTEPWHPSETMIRCDDVRSDGGIFVIGTWLSAPHVWRWRSGGCGGVLGGHPWQTLTTGEKERGGKVRVEEVPGAPRTKTRKKLSIHSRQRMIGL